MASKLSRREALAAAGVGALALGGGAYAAFGGGDDDQPTPTPQTGASTSASEQCVLTPEQTEGPYYVEDSRVRRDITEGGDGLPLLLNLLVQDADSCEPLRNATVEVWHCDAEGVYSGVAGDGGTFMRGAQRGGSEGKVSFQTVYPGWYQGRAPHIHVKVHVSGDTVHTGQLYFDDAISRRVYARAPYAARGPAETLNDSDGIYADGGRESTLRLARDGDGYVGTIALGLRA